MKQSNVEKNVSLQPRLIQRILDLPRPGWMDELRSKRIFFVGIGTSQYAAQISTWLWRRYVSPNACLVHSFDFVRTPQPVASGDAVVLFSHSGAKSFTVQASELARKSGAVTVGITCENSPWKDSLSHCLETCEREDVGVHTKSLTTALAWIVRWIADAELSRGIQSACERLEEGPSFPALANKSQVQPSSPSKTSSRTAVPNDVFGTNVVFEGGLRPDLVLIGDTVRESVAREIALKTQEAAYLRSRAFGLEEFLHGPCVSVGSGTMVVCFSAKDEDRWRTVRDYLRIIEVPMIEVQPEAVGLPPSAGWLWQLFWGQRLTLNICKQLGVDPDTLRTHEPRYKKAREQFSL